MRLSGREECAKYDVLMAEDLRTFPADGPIEIVDDVKGTVVWCDKAGHSRTITLGPRKIRLLEKGRF